MRLLTGNRILLGIIFALILFGVVGLVVSHADSVYVPLTTEQAAAYIARVGPDEIVQEIIQLDWIQHVAPIVAVPPSLIAIHGRDASLAWQGPLTVTVPPLPGSTAVMPMYTIQLKDTTFAGVVPGPNRDGYIEVGVLGVAVGIVATLLIHH